MENLSPTPKEDGSIEISVRFTTRGGMVTTGILAQPATPAKRAVILCHGFLSNKNSRTNRRLSDLLMSASIATLRFDWYGMGESPGSFPAISIQKCEEQLDAAFQFLAEHTINAVGLVGSSFGGLLAILAAPRHSPLLALGLKCPVVDFPEVLRLEFGPEAIEQWKRTDRIPNILGGEESIPLPYAFFEECLAYNGYAAASTIHTPTFIVHGDQDSMIPFHQIDQLLASLTGPKHLQLISGADHYFGRPEDFRLMTTHLAHWLIDEISTAS